jgi:hypothetical protein
MRSITRVLGVGLLIMMRYVLLWIVVPVALLVWLTSVIVGTASRQRIYGPRTWITYLDETVWLTLTSILGQRGRAWLDLPQEKRMTLAEAKRYRRGRLTEMF